MTDRPERLRQEAARGTRPVYMLVAIDTSAPPSGMDRVKKTLAKAVWAYFNTGARVYKVTYEDGARLATPGDRFHYDPNVHSEEA